MTILESILICCVYLTGFMVFFTICAGILWILEKIGLLQWLRGWAWYFGWTDTYPESERRKK